MQMLNLKKLNKKNVKKSQVLLFGSLLIFVGLIVISHNHLLRLRNEVYGDMQIAMYDNTGEGTQFNETTIDQPMDVNDEYVEQEVNYANTINYEQYLGVLRIPKIGLRRGFFGLDSRYNDINYNVTLVEGSTMPDVDKGNLILVAHSGTAYISFFAYLYRLDIGDDVYVTYNHNEYHYRIVNIYYVDKTGKVEIVRNNDKTSLTMITCTKDDDYHQTVYISELV